MNTKQKYVALLRGINVGGHHKLPMAELRKEMEKLGATDVTTLLNSGNVIFNKTREGEAGLEKKIATHLENVFGFPVPVLIRKAEEIIALVKVDPFREIEVTKNIRLYISFLKKQPERKLKLPWVSDDGSCRITDVRDSAVCSVLDLSVTKTPKGMEALEKLFGKDMTTRNWKTVKRIADKLT